ncbi:hypothetical protein [Fimbriiglobus ruber]|uniref:TapB family protein n=1 Tax=Fimbriiglobus ruber TaxID=1908690 RepID=UPI000B4BF6DD|nr:hypothetical protein [Fimbriiglobus ruber]
MKIDPPKCLIQMPIKLGARWNWKLADGPEHTSMVRGVERVEAPAGAFTAVRIEYSMKVDGKTETTTSWFAEGVGIVKTEADGIVAVLESFTPGKP